MYDRYGMSAVKGEGEMSNDSKMINLFVMLADIVEV